MIVFELSMPNKGSWNGKWSGEDQCYIRVKTEKEVPKHIWNKDFYYTWDDGWTACVKVIRVPYAEAKKLEKRSNGFCDYDWMIKSLINHGEIKLIRN